MAESKIKEDAIKIISTYMGDVTGKMYQQFYEDKDDSTILSSLNELLAEYLGKTKATLILQKNLIKI